MHQKKVNKTKAAVYSCLLGAFLGYIVYTIYTKPIIQRNENAPYHEIDLTSDLPNVLFPHDQSVVEGQHVCGLEVVASKDLESSCARIPDGLVDFAKRTIFVTSVSPTYSRRLHNLIGSIQMHHQDSMIVVWDLSASDNLFDYNLDCVRNTKLFHMSTNPVLLKIVSNELVKQGIQESNGLPLHILDLMTYAFKSVVLQATRTMFPGRPLISIDAGAEIWKPMTAVLEGMKTRGYFLTDQRTPASMIHPGSLESLTRYGVFDVVPAPSDYASHHHVSGGLIGVNDQFPSSFSTQILNIWFACSVNPDCIAPPGSDLSNHKFDQSILTILIEADSASYVRGDLATFAADWAVMRDENLARNVVLFSRRGHCPQPYIGRVLREQSCTATWLRSLSRNTRKVFSASVQRERFAGRKCGWWAAPLVLAHTLVGATVGGAVVMCSIYYYYSNRELKQS